MFGVRWDVIFCIHETHDGANNTKGNVKEEDPVPRGLGGCATNDRAKNGAGGERNLFEGWRGKLRHGKYFGKINNSTGMMPTLMMPVASPTWL